MLENLCPEVEGIPEEPPADQPSPPASQTGPFRWVGGKWVCKAEIADQPSPPASQTGPFEWVNGEWVLR